MLARFYKEEVGFEPNEFFKNALNTGVPSSMNLIIIYELTYKVFTECTWIYLILSPDFVIIISAFSVIFNVLLYFVPTNKDNKISHHVELSLRHSSQ